MTIRTLAREALRNWEISPDESLANFVTDRLYLVGERRVLKCAERGPVWHADLQFEVLRYLERSGLPIAVPEIARDGRSFIECGGYHFVLMPRLSNSRSTVTAEELLQSCGCTIAKLHLALARYRNDALTARLWRTEPLRELTELRLPALRSSLEKRARHRLEVVEQVVAEEVAADVNGLPEQMIHRDLHCANIVFNDSGVAGVVDWDHLSFGSVVVDLAYFLVNCALSDQLGPSAVPFSGTAARWRAAMGPLLVAYNSVGALSESERAALASLMIWAALTLADEHRRRRNHQWMIAYLDILDDVLQSRHQIRESAVVEFS